MRLFISHGTDRTAADEIAFVTELEGRLCAIPGVEILLDLKQITAGDLWGRVLDDCLKDCQGAIALIGPRALARPWVHHECGVLAYRKRTEAGFPLFTALIGGATPDQLSTGPLDCLRLGDIQAFPAQVTPADIAAKVATWTAANKPMAKTALDSLIEALAVQMRNGDPDALEELSEELGRRVSWTLGAQRAKASAMQIARAIVLDDLGDVESLASLVSRLRNAGVDPAACRRIADLVAPRWVRPGTASRLGMHVEDIRSATAEKPAKELALALNTTQIAYGPKMHTWRARLNDPRENVYLIAGGGSPKWGQEIFDRIFDAYVEKHQRTVRSRADAAQVLRHLKQPIFVVVPPPVPDEVLLRALRESMPRVVFLANTGAQPSSRSTLPPGVEPLEPPVDPQREFENHGDYAEVDQVIGP